MPDWSGGYVTDIAYTFGYQVELNPLHARFAFLNAGLSPPSQGVHCELGFGHGLSVNIHAAASDTVWYATDFNPAQAAFAQEIAVASKARIHLCDQSFEEFCARPDLPEFDSIGLHGIWSWISEGNRSIVVEFIRKKLKIGGVLYISYNSQPGWAATVPLRDLFADYAEFIGGGGSGYLDRVESSIEFAEKVLSLNPLYARMNPIILERIKHIKTQNKNYLAHEYFGGSWQPFSFSQVARSLAPAKLTFACSARLFDEIHFANLEPQQQEFIRAIPHPYLQQTVKDFCVNQQFRRDYWVKGLRKLDKTEQMEMLRSQSFVLIEPISEILVKIKEKSELIAKRESIFESVLSDLHKYKVFTLRELEKSLSGKANFRQILDMLIILCGMDCVVCSYSLDAIEKSNASCERLNDYILSKAKSNSNINFLASPVTGGAINVNRLDQLFISSIRAGSDQISDWAQYAWEIMSLQGQIIKNGKTLSSYEENLNEVANCAQDFAKEKLPILKALRVVV